ncbi:ImuA family protein [Novosphingobium sp. ZW T3_23]|uniref:ImuA family protein n=1 Tax=Novosphingobium sp. ZW T3_23 TaxID=3378084 RepID=UPI003853D754
MFDSSRLKRAASLVQPSLEGWPDVPLQQDGVHEFYATQSGDGAALALALLCAIQGRKAGEPLLWLRLAKGKQARQRPYAPGLAELGLDPATMVLMRLPDLQSLLRAGIDCVRHGSAGAVVMEMDGRAPAFDLTASRRLALAAEQSGTMVMIVRSGADPAPSAAHTRWQVASAPSVPLPANAPGGPVFDVTLLRRRGGRDGLNLQLEWDRERTAFQDPTLGRAPLPGGNPALPAVRTGDAGRRSAA